MDPTKKTGGDQNIPPINVSPTKKQPGFLEKAGSYLSSLFNIGSISSGEEYKIDDRKWSNQTGNEDWKIDSGFEVIKNKDEQIKELQGKINNLKVVRENFSSRIKLNKQLFALKEKKDKILSEKKELSDKQKDLRMEKESLKRNFLSSDKTISQEILKRNMAMNEVRLQGARDSRVILDQVPIIMNSKMNESDKISHIEVYKEQAGKILSDANKKADLMQKELDNYKQDAISKDKDLSGKLSDLDDKIKDIDKAIENKNEDISGINKEMTETVGDFKKLTVSEQTLSKDMIESIEMNLQSIDEEIKSLNAQIDDLIKL